MLLESVKTSSTEYSFMGQSKTVEEYNNSSGECQWNLDKKTMHQ